MRIEMFGQGNGPLSRAALCSKNWIKTPYDLVNVMHSHLFEHRNKRKVHFLRTFFLLPCSTTKPKTNFYETIFYTCCSCNDIHGPCVEPNSGRHCRGQ